MASLINRLWSGADFWQKKENEKQRQQFAQQPPQQPNQPPRQSFGNKIIDQFSANTEADNYRRQQQNQDTGTDAAIRNIQNITRAGGMNRNEAAARINALATNSAVQDNMANAVVKPQGGLQMPGQKVIDIATNRKVAPVAMGIGRSGAGTAEGLSGLYDLLTPGTGQNRFGKMAQNAGATADQVVNREAYNKLAYKGGQAFGDVATFMAGGAPLEKAVATGTGLISKAPVIGKAITSVDEAAKAGNLVARGAKYLTKPAVLSDMVSDTALSAGLRSNRGKEVTPATLAADAAMSVGMGAGIGLAGLGVKQAYKGAKKATPEVIDAAKTVKYTTDKLDPSVRELDRQYDQLNKQWQAASPQARRNIDAAIKQNRLERNRYTRVAFGNSMVDVRNEVATPELPTRTQPVIAPPEPPKPKVQTAPDAPIQPPRSAMTATGGEMIPTSNGAVDMPQPGKKTRYADKTIPQSEYVSGDVKQSLDSPEYTPNTEKQAYAESGRKYQQQGEDQFFLNSENALNKPNGTINRQEAVDAQTTAQLLDARGDDLSRRRAADIYDKLSAHYTAAGQTVQAAAIMARRSPESLMYHAINTLQKAGIQLDDGLRRELQAQIDVIKQMKPGAQRDYEINKLMKKVDDNIPSDLADKITSTWKAGLLTGIKTQTGNFLSNGTFGVLHDVSNPGAALIDKGISLITGKRTKTLTTRGRMAGIGEGTVKGAKFVKTGVDERLADVGKYEGGGVSFGNSKGGKILNTYVNGVFKIMGAADRPAYYSQLRNSLNDLAIAEAKNKGLKGEARAAFIKEFTTNPPAKAAQTAIDEANQATLNYDTLLSKAMAGVNTAIGKIKPESKIGKFAAKMAVAMNAPFVRVPSAFLSRTIDFTALGVPKEVMHQISKGQFDQRALSTAISEAGTGTALLATGVALANANLLTGSYPNDQKEAQRWKAQGIQPNSVKMGDTYVSLNYLGPVGIIFGMSSRYKDEMTKGSNAVSSVATAAGGIPKSLTEQSFLQGLNNAIGAINDPARFAARYAQSTAGSIIPTLSNDIATATDSLQRNVSSAGDAIASRIPGVRNNLKPSQDVYGNEIPRKTGGINSAVNPFRPSDYRTNDVKSEVERLHNADVNNKDLQVTPTPIDKAFTSGEAKVTLNKDQQYELQKQIGQATQEAWGNIIKTPEYQALSDVDKANALNKLRQDVTSVQQRTFAAKNGLGEYVTDYTGKPSKLTASQKAIAGGNIRTSNYTTVKGDSPNTSYKDKYDNLVAEFNDKSNNWSEIERTKKTKELSKLKVQKDYENDTVDLYGMGKEDIYNFVTTNQKGKAYLDKALAYGDALVAAGVEKTNKLRDKYGNVAIAPKGKSGGKKGGKKSAKLPLDLLAKAAKVPSVGRVKQTSITANKVAAPSMKTQRKAIPKFAAKTPKLTVKRTKTA